MSLSSIQEIKTSKILINWNPDATFLLRHVILGTKYINFALVPEKQSLKKLYKYTKMIKRLINAKPSSTPFDLFRIISSKFHKLVKVHDVSRLPNFDSIINFNHLSNSKKLTLLLAKPFEFENSKTHINSFRKISYFGNMKHLIINYIDKNFLSIIYKLPKLEIIKLMLTFENYQNCKNDIKSSQFKNPSINLELNLEAKVATEDQQTDLENIIDDDFISKFTFNVFNRINRSTRIFTFDEKDEKHLQKVKRLIYTDDCYTGDINILSFAYLPLLKNLRTLDINIKSVVKTAANLVHNLSLPEFLEDFSLSIITFDFSVVNSSDFEANLASVFSELKCLKYFKILIIYPPKFHELNCCKYFSHLFSVLNPTLKTIDAEVRLPEFERIKWNTKTLNTFLKLEKFENLETLAINLPIDMDDVIPETKIKCLPKLLNLTLIKSSNLIELFEKDSLPKLEYFNVIQNFSDDKISKILKQKLDLLEYCKNIRDLNIELVCDDYAQMDSETISHITSLIGSLKNVRQVNVKLLNMSTEPQDFDKLAALAFPWQQQVLSNGSLHIGDQKFVKAKNVKESQFASKDSK